MHLFKLVFFFSDIYIGVGVLAPMINSVIAEKAFETIQQQFMIIKKTHHFLYLRPSHQSYFIILNVYPLEISLTKTWW